MRHVELLLSHLRDVRPQGHGYIACCPAHDDAHPSLSITIQDDGHVRLYCRSARCTLANILHAIDLTPADLSPDPDEEIIGHGDTELIAVDPGARRNGLVPAEADLDLRDRVYRTLLNELPLMDHHRDDLRRRGLSDEQMVFRGYRSLTGFSRREVLAILQTSFSVSELVSVPGFVTRDDGVLEIVASHGLLIPVLDVNGRAIAIKVRRDGVADGVGKYVCMSGGGGPSCGTPVHVPLGITGPTSDVRLTEGELKADVATILSGLPTIGIPGVSNWPSAIPVLQALGARTVGLAFDADWRTKPHVARNLVECAAALRTHGFNIVVEWWPMELGKGIDDLLAAGHRPEVLSGDEAVTFLTTVGAISVPVVDTPAIEMVLEPAILAPPIAIASTDCPANHTARNQTDTVLPFPTTVFPLALQQFARCAATSLGCPIDLIAVPMLVIAAVAIGASRAIEAKPGWWESPRMYVAVVAPPGSAKSPAESIVSRPVFRLQNRFHTEYKAALAEFKAAEAQRRPQGRRTRNPGERPQPAEAEPTCGETRTGEPSLPPEPQFRRITTCDATTESLAPLLMKNPRGLAMVKDELTGWIRGMNQYKGGKGSDKQFYLSCWSGQAAIVDRKSQSEPVIVPRPFLNVLGGIQPDMLSVLMDEYGRADGFMDRIVFSFPEPCSTRP